MEKDNEKSIKQEIIKFTKDKINYTITYNGDFNPKAVANSIKDIYNKNLLNNG